MARKRITKAEINAALRALNDTWAYAQEIRQTEGNHEANAFLAYSDTRFRAGNAIRTLRQAGQPLPEWMDSNWSYLRAIGWHCEPNGSLRA